MGGMGGMGGSGVILTSPRKKCELAAFHFLTATSVTAFQVNSTNR